MDDKKIIDGKEYHQIPVDKIYIDGIAFGSTFTTEELFVAKKLERARSHTEPSPLLTSTPSDTPSDTAPDPIPDAPKLSSPSLPCKKSKNSITLNKNLFIASIVFLIGAIALLLFILL